MTKKKPVVVHITKTRHKKQPYTFSVDTAGPDLTKKTRYTDAYSAKRAALSLLDARNSSGIAGRTWRYSGGYAWFTPKGRPIQFLFTKTK